MWTADDKFFGGLPHHPEGERVAEDRGPCRTGTTCRGIVPAEEASGTLTYPLDWDGLLEYVGLPWRPEGWPTAGGGRDVYVCRSKDDLLHHYNHSGLLTMIVQEFIEWEHFVRCICIGQEEILPIKYDPKERKYHREHDHLTPELGKTIVEQSKTICGRWATT